jgi:hypothetical protein
VATFVFALLRPSSPRNKNNRGLRILSYDRTLFGVAALGEKYDIVPASPKDVPSPR